MATQDINALLDTQPPALPANVARVKSDGTPTTHLIDWELFQTDWFRRNIVATDQRIDQVKATANGASAAVTTESQARADADGALASRIDTVEAKANGNAAAITSEATARANGDGALSLRIDSVQATAGNATANGQIFFAAKAAPGGAAAAYGLYLTAGNAYAGLEVLADSGGGASIAFTANDFKLTDSGTAQNVFNYTGGVFTFNVPVQIGTVDILAGAINAPAAMTANNTLTVGDTGGGWTTIASVSSDGASGYVALVHADFEYRVTPGWSGVFDGQFRVVRNDGQVLYGPSSLFNYANFATVAISRLASGFNATYTYSLQVNLNLSSTSGTPSADFRRRGIMIDLRKR